MSDVCVYLVEIKAVAFFNILAAYGTVRDFLKIVFISPKNQRFSGPPLKCQLKRQSDGGGYTHADVM